MCVHVLASYIIRNEERVSDYAHLRWYVGRHMKEIMELMGGIEIPEPVSLNWWKVIRLETHSLFACMQIIRAND